MVANCTKTISVAFREHTTITDFQEAVVLLLRRPKNMLLWSRWEISLDIVTQVMVSTSLSDSKIQTIHSRMDFTIIRCMAHLCLNERHKDFRMSKRSLENCEDNQVGLSHIRSAGSGLAVSLSLRTPRGTTLTTELLMQTWNTRLLSDEWTILTITGESPPERWLEGHIPMTKLLVGSLPTTISKRHDWLKTDKGQCFQKTEIIGIA